LKISTNHKAPHQLPQENAIYVRSEVVTAVLWLLSIGVWHHIAL